jgi:hypothetical protein
MTGSVVSPLDIAAPLRYLYFGVWRVAGLRGLMFEGPSKAGAAGQHGELPDQSSDHSIPQGKEAVNKLKTIIAALAFAAAISVPAAAAGTPLLSGYGGPGTGPQQILGAGLVKGGGGRGGGPGAGSGGGQTGLHAGGSSAGVSSDAGGSAGVGSLAGGSSAGVGSDAGASRRGGASRRSSTGSAGIGVGARGRHGRTPTRPTGGSSSSVAEPTASRFTTPQASTLGLSDGELMMILILVAGLALTAISTRWLASLQDRRRPADKDPMSLGSGQ